MKPSPNLFFLLISPPPELAEYVSFLKREVRRLIGHAYQSLYSKAHLSLKQYYDLHNESSLYTYSDRAAHIRSFEISISGFNTFGSNGTIYLDLLNKYYVGSVAEMLVGKAITPHFTIARNLIPKDFDVVWNFLKTVAYSYSFQCDRITVLKRVDNRWMPHDELILGCPNPGLGLCPQRPK